MNRILGPALCVLAAVLMILLLAAIVGTGTSDEFEYHTASGQTGTAAYCTAEYGQAHCRTADGEIVVVERYRKLK